MQQANNSVECCVSVKVATKFFTLTSCRNLCNKCYIVGCVFHAGPLIDYKFGTEMTIEFSILFATLYCVMLISVNYTLLNIRFIASVVLLLLSIQEYLLHS